VRRLAKGISGSCLHGTLKIRKRDHWRVDVRACCSRCPILAAIYSMLLMVVASRFVPGADLAAGRRRGQEPGRRHSGKTLMRPKTLTAAAHIEKHPAKHVMPSQVGARCLMRSGSEDAARATGSLAEPACALWASAAQAQTTSRMTSRTSTWRSCNQQSSPPALDRAARPGLALLPVAPVSQQRLLWRRPLPLQETHKLSAESI